MNLEIRNLEYRAGKLCLEADTVLHGRICGLFGPSGCGKTTLLEVIAGFRRPQKGKILFDNRLLMDSQTSFFLSPHLRKIGYVPQDLALFPHLNVHQNVLYGAKEKVPPKIYQHIVDVLGLESLLNRQTGALSGGEKQRVALARAILGSPELMLLDEPLSSLNLELKERISELILRIRDEFQVPMVYVSHDASELLTICDEVVLMEEGRTLQKGKPSEILRYSPGLQNS